MRFGESTSSQIIRTTATEYVTIHGPFAWLSIGCIPAHLARAEVAALHDCMGRWLARNPEPSKSMEVPDVV